MKRDFLINKVVYREHESQRKGKPTKFFAGIIQGEDDCYYSLSGFDFEIFEGADESTMSPVSGYEQFTAYKRAGRMSVLMEREKLAEKINELQFMLENDITLERYREIVEALKLYETESSVTESAH